MGFNLSGASTNEYCFRGGHHREGSESRDESRKYGFGVDALRKLGEYHFFGIFNGGEAEEVR